MKNSLIHIALLIFILSPSIISCEENGDTNMELSGIWIESAQRFDTIDFESWPTDSVFLLKRGFEIQNGYLLPKANSGIYKFKLEPDAIRLVNMFSSCECYSQYYFKMYLSNSVFKIGNFYDTT